MILVLPFVPLPHFLSLVSEKHFIFSTVLKINEEKDTKQCLRCSVQHVGRADSSLSLCSLGLSLEKNKKVH